MKQHLDSSAVFHTAMMDENWLNTYRFGITLKEKIDPERLQYCVNQLVSKYPMICCKIKHNFFHHYTEPLEQLMVQEDKHPLLRSVNFPNIQNQAITILYNENTIILEAFHAITDGHGAITYLKDLLRLYVLDSTFTTTNQPKISFTYDSFQQHKHHSKTKKVYTNENGSFFRFHKRDNNQPILATTLEIDTLKVRDIAKQYSCGINDLIITIFYRAILNAYDTQNKTVSIQVPVNLRNHFPSDSLLNFTLCIITKIQNEYKDLSLEEMVQHIRSQVKDKNTKEYFEKEIAKVAKPQSNAIVKYIPLKVKSSFIKYYYLLMKEPSCLTITNLGRIDFEDSKINDQIVHMDCILSPRYHTPYNCGIISINNKLHINITHDDKDILVEEIKKQFMELGISTNCYLYKAI